jgi:acetyltransferase
VVRDTFTTRDGRELLIRPIEPGDKARLAAGHARLSENTIRLRYLAAKPGLSASELRYLTEVDGHDHLALVALLADEPDTLVGVSRAIRLRDRPWTAEWAVVIGDDFQGVGLGGHLSRAVAEAATRVGITTFTATTSGENVAVQRVMRSFTHDLDSRWVGAGVRELEGELSVGHLAAGSFAQRRRMGARLAA